MGETHSDVWTALCDTKDEAEQLRMRSMLMRNISRLIKVSPKTQRDIAKDLSITAPRVSNLMKGHIEKFSVDELVKIGVKLGLNFDLTITNGAKDIVDEKPFVASGYIDKIAPKHTRTSCSDDNLYNAAYGLDDFDGHGRCYRCTLLAAQLSANPEYSGNKPKEKDDDEL